MTQALLEVMVVLVLVTANGVFAASEFALVASRKARLRKMAADGDSGAALALELAQSPTRFLSTVQIGITSIAVVAGAFGGVRAGRSLEAILVEAGVPDAFASRAAILIVVAGITFLTVVFGELVPKRLALHDPERVASRTSGLMQRLAWLGTPIVRLLSRTTDLLFSAFGLPEREESEISEEEIRSMIAHATRTGILEATEQQITERLFHLSDTRVTDLMTPRSRIAWLDLRAGPPAWREAMGEIRHTRYLVADGDLDRVVGYMSVADLLKWTLDGKEMALEPLICEPHRLPGWTSAFRLLELFQWSGDHIALVTDDRGRLIGLVTLNDVLEGIVGELPKRWESQAPEMVQREDGSWLADGLLPFGRVLTELGVERPAREEYPTLHSFIVENLDHPPRSASTLRWNGLRLEIMDMDGTRIDKVLVTLED